MKSVNMLVKLMKESSDDVVVVMTRSGKQINQDAKDLVECCGIASAYDSYREQTFEEKLRQACGVLRDAIQSEAMRGVGDDGRQFKRVDYTSNDPNVWQQIDKALMTEIYPDRFKELLAVAKKVVEDNLE